jgi:hypothetical protein
MLGKLSELLYTEPPPILLFGRKDCGTPILGPPEDIDTKALMRGPPDEGVAVVCINVLLGPDGRCAEGVAGYI